MSTMKDHNFAASVSLGLSIKIIVILNCVNLSFVYKYLTYRCKMQWHSWFTFNHTAYKVMYI